MIEHDRFEGKFLTYITWWIMIYGDADHNRSVPRKHVQRCGHAQIIGRVGGKTQIIQLTQPSDVAETK